MARISLLVLLAAGVVTSTLAATASGAANQGQPADPETTPDKAARAKKDTGYPYGGYNNYNSGYSYNRGYGAYPATTYPATTYPTTYPTAAGYATGGAGFYNQDLSRSYPGAPYNQYNQWDPRYGYQPGYNQAGYSQAGYNQAGYYQPGYQAGYNNYNRYNAYPGYNGYGYDARTTGYGGASRYPYEDRFYSNYPYNYNNNNYNRYPNDYNRRASYDNRLYPGYGGYNYNTGSGANYPNYPINHEYYYTPSASSYSGRYLKKRDGKEPAAAASANVPVAAAGPTPATTVA